MSGDEDYVYDEASGEWLPASEARERAASDDAVEVRDAVGNLLADGDQVTLIKDLTVKGAGQTLKRGTLIKSIRLTGDPQEIDCRYEGIKGLVLRAEFVRKRGGITPAPPPATPPAGGRRLLRPRAPDRASRGSRTGSAGRPGDCDTAPRRGRAGRSAS